jgi:hypothetical protein
MIRGLMEFYEKIKLQHMLIPTLRADLLHRLSMPAPNYYPNYRRRAAAQNDKCLTHWEWRTLTAVLQGLLPAAEILDSDPGPRAQQVRCLLAGAREMLLQLQQDRRTTANKGQRVGARAQTGGAAQRRTR